METDCLTNDSHLSITNISSSSTRRIDAAANDDDANDVIITTTAATLTINNNLSTRHLATNLDNKQSSTVNCTYHTCTCSVVAREHYWSRRLFQSKSRGIRAVTAGALEPGISPRLSDFTPVCKAGNRTRCIIIIIIIIITKVPCTSVTRPRITATSTT